MGISPQQLAEMERRLARGRIGSARSPGVAASVQAAAPDPLPDRILGLDPSLRGTGWGVIRLEGRQPRTVACGTIRCPAGWERSRCLGQIASTLAAVLVEHPAAVCAVEGLFHAQNLHTALIMGEARGAALSVVAGAGLPIYEIATRKVKLAVVGYGAADKVAVARMVQRLTGMTEVMAPDAADALAVAIAYSQEAARITARPLRRV